MKTTGRLCARGRPDPGADRCTETTAGRLALRASGGTAERLTAPPVRRDDQRPPGSSVYRYVNAGLQAILDLDADTLEISNETDSDLQKPGFYVLDARDGTQIDGRVVDPTGVPAGETATFGVTLEGIELRNIGFVVLLVGEDNLGAFVQQ
jgi:hypothetical protein